MSGSDGGILAPGADPAGARPERPTTARRGGRRGRPLDRRDQDATDRRDRHPGDGLHHVIDALVIDDDFQLELRDEIHPVFDAAVALGM